MALAIGGSRQPIKPNDLNNVNINYCDAVLVGQMCQSKKATSQLASI